MFALFEGFLGSIGLFVDALTGTNGIISILTSKSDQKTGQA
jgi:hypothetical protein